MRAIALVCASFVSASVYAQTCGLPLEQSAPDARFEVDAADPGVVNDLRTGLSWQRCVVGEEIDDANTDLLSDDTCVLIDREPQDGVADINDSDLDNDIESIYTWYGALEYADSKGDGWRMPNLKELASLVEYSCYSPAMNTNVFPDTRQSNYWSNTTDSVDDSSAWGISFSLGEDESLAKSSSGYLLLVRD